jgi:hypothetical protein
MYLKKYVVFLFDFCITLRYQIITLTISGKKIIITPFN